MKSVLKCLKDLDKIFEESNEIVIYGAGRVCYALLQYVTRNELWLSKVYCIVVSKKLNNPDSIMGIPVCVFSDVNPRKEVTVIVATFENAHISIVETLECSNYKKVDAVANVLYAELRRENKDFATDIIQNTQWILDELRTTRVKIDRMNEKIAAIDQKTYKIEKCINNNVRHYDEILSPQYYERELKRWYKDRTGRELDLDNPQTYNEKIQWTKLYGVTPLMTKLADKYEVRKWVAEKIGEEYLVPLIGVWDDFNEIQIEKMPQAFVLKCNHGCEWNEIVTDKDKWNWRSAKRKFDYWMESNYAFWGGLQLQYKDIRPRIIAEKYLCCNGNVEADLPDYKFFCFDGKVFASYVMVDYQKDHSKGKMGFFDRDFKLLPFYRKDFGRIEEQPSKPNNYDKMVEIAEKLSTDLPHVRVDLYLVDEKIYFGEMTFTQGNGVGKFEPEEFDNILGKQWKLR